MTRTREKKRNSSKITETAATNKGNNAMQKRKSEKTNEEAATSHNNHAKKQKTPHKLKRTCKKLDTNSSQIKMEVREERNKRNAG